MALLAQAVSTSLDGEFLLKLFLAVGFVASAAMNVTQLVRGKQAQDRNVRMMPHAVSKEDFDKHVEEDKKERDFLHERISSGDRHLAQQMREDNETLHEKINKVDRELGAIGKATELQTTHLVRIEQSLERDREVRPNARTR